MRVSVALATHNGQRWLRPQVESILQQTRLPDELVLSDDASTDGTVALVQELLTGSSIDLVVLRHDPPLRVTRNFEAAVRATTGDIVLLSDQDDVWHPDRVAVSVAALEAGADLVHADARLVDADGRPIGHTLFEALELSDHERTLEREGRAFDALLRRNLATGATVAFRRSLLDAALPFPEGWVHDEWLAIVAAATGRVGLIERPVIDYRQHGTNQIGVEKLSLGGKLGRLREPRGVRNDRLLANSAVLAQRLADLDVSESVLTSARAKAAHERMRHGLPASRLRRIGSVLRAAWRGDYRRYSRGAPDVLRDLVQPA